jgi:hypothetical protein
MPRTPTGRLGITRSKGWEEADRLTLRRPWLRRTQSPKTAATFFDFLEGGNWTLYPKHLQQIQTISTNPAPPNVLLIVPCLTAILEKWPGIQLSWDVGLR